jgi:hypothetical protein
LAYSLLLRNSTGTYLYCMFSNFLLLFTNSSAYYRHKSRVPISAIPNLLYCISLVHSLKTTVTPLIRARPLPSPFQFTTHQSPYCSMPKLGRGTDSVIKGKGKVPHWGTSTPQPKGLLCSHSEGVPSFISRGAAHRTVCSASASEGRNYVKGILLPI